MQKCFEKTIEVRYRDTDSMGHISSPVYYDYMQSAYLEYMHLLLDLPTTEKLPHIMVKTSCEYISQAYYGDDVVVCSRVSKFGSKSFEIEHEIKHSSAEGRLVARLLSVHVMFDYEQQTTYAVPDDFKRSVATYQGEA